MLVFALAAASAAVSDKPYVSDIKLGILKRVDKCKSVVTRDSLVYCHVVARVLGHAAPIIDTHGGKPLYFRASSRNVIPGLTKGIIGACKGEIRRITIPPALSYGEESVDGLFPPASSWVADVEIVDVVDSSSY